LQSHQASTAQGRDAEITAAPQKNDGKRCDSCNCDKYIVSYDVLVIPGLQMHLPGAHGQWHERTVVPTIAFGSYDNPETKKVAGVKDGYRNMAMFCVL
jgi:hypothetical protein